MPTPNRLQLIPSSNRQCLTPTPIRQESPLRAVLRHSKAHGIQPPAAVGPQATNPTCPSALAAATPAGVQKGGDITVFPPLMMSPENMRTTNNARRRTTAEKSKLNTSLQTTNSWTLLFGSTNMKKRSFVRSIHTQGDATTSAALNGCPAS